MEKKLFLAVGLSLLVVFGFQTFFAPKPSAPVATPQVSSNNLKNNTVPMVAGSVPAVVRRSLGFKEESYAVHAGKMDLTVSNDGASIQAVHLNDYTYDFPVKSIAELDLFRGKLFSLDKQTNSTAVFSSSNSDWTIKKTLNVDNYKIDILYSIRNNGLASKQLDLMTKPFDIDLSSLDNNASKPEWTLFEYAFKHDKGIDRKEQASNFGDKWNKDEIKNIEWISFRDHYFAVVVQPKTKFTQLTTKTVNTKELALTTHLPAVTVLPGQTFEYSFTVFCGPQRLDILKQANEGFEKVMVFSSWGWLDAIAKAIYWMLGAVHKILPVWGLCIIVVSLIVYGVMYPLTLKSLVSMKKMQSLQPKMAQLKEKHKNSPEKLNKEIVELYRINNVNPVSGCLPMLLQMPIFIGLYQVLWRSIYFRGESFLWMKDLSLPDRLVKLPFTIPFLGEYFNLLPLMMMGIMMLQQMVTLKAMSGGDPEQVQQQKIMAVFFPIFLGFIFYNFASGLNLYFVVFYALSGLSQWHVSKGVKATS
jgi:YidC/Oxa1 family membrane protein insertase